MIRGIRKGSVLFFTTCVIASIWIYRAYDRSQLVDSYEIIRPLIKRTHLSNYELLQNNSVYEEKWTYEYLSSLCRKSPKHGMAEDLFCKKRPKFLPNYKNPCWIIETPDKKDIVQCMPYFHLLGADKCGSTDLFDRILQHPEMEPSSCGLHKECYYWCWVRYGLWMRNNSEQTNKVPIRSYFRHFYPPSLSISLREEGDYHPHITGEGTPMDLWDFRGWPRIPQNENLDEPVIMTPHLMRHVYPDPKLIVILREPADRLYSDYYFLGYGFSASSFHKDTVRAITMIQECAARWNLRRCIFDMDMYSNLPMRIHISCYSIFLREWMRVFPRENFLILRNEDYGRDIRNHMELVFNFLNISRLPEEEMLIISNSQRKHITQSKKNKGPMLNATRRILNEFFAPFNEELAMLLQDKRFLWLDKR